MSRIRPKDLLLPSVLDRLLDDEPDNRQELDKDRAQLLRDLKASLARDLQDLLNTRIPFAVIPERFRHVRGSILNYGVPDFNALVTDASDTLSWMESVIQETIERFEPRLHDVRVKAEGASRFRDLRTVQFRIEGILQADPAPEEVVYKSEMSTVNKQFSVTKDR